MNNPYPTPDELWLEKHNAALAEERRKDLDRIRRAKQSWDAVKNELAALLKCHVPNCTPVYQRCVGWLENCDFNMAWLLEQIEEGAR